LRAAFLPRWSYHTKEKPAITPCFEAEKERVGVPSGRPMNASQMNEVRKTRSLRKEQAIGSYSNSNSALS